MDSNTSSPNANVVLAMRVCGVLMILFSIVEFGIGGAAYRIFVDFKAGAWWAAILPFIAGVFAVVSQPKGIIIAGIVVSSLGVVTTLVGAITDSLSHDFALSQTACCSYSSTSSCYSDSSSTAVSLLDVAECIAGSANALDYLDGNFCECVDVNNFCWLFEGEKSLGDCAIIFTTWPSLLSASTGVCAWLLIISFTYAILGCMSACSCCPTSNVPATTTTTPLTEGTVNSSAPIDVNKSAVTAVPIVYAPSAPSTPGFGVSTTAPPHAGAPLQGTVVMIDDKEVGGGNA